MKKKKKLTIVICLIMFAVLWNSPLFSSKAYAASSEMELLQTAISHIKEDVYELQTKISNMETKIDTHIQSDSVASGKDGTDGVGISKIEKTDTKGNTDTYTITLTNGNTSTFNVTNGIDGKNGTDGTDGTNGEDGQDL